MTTLERIMAEEQRRQQWRNVAIEMLEQAERAESQNHPLLAEAMRAGANYAYHQIATGAF